MDKVYVNVDRYGNTSSASIPIALDEAIEQRTREGGHDGAARRVRRRLHVGLDGRPLLSGHAMDVVLLFPGQGSQKPGMGSDLADALPRRARGRSTPPTRRSACRSRRLCFEGPADELTLTHNAQPALLAHGAAVWAVVRDDARRRACVAAAGHSLGEFTAYHAAGALSLADAVALVRRRGELMFEAGVARPGAMAAVLGEPSRSDRGDLRAGDARRRGSSCRPTTTRPGQVVISGEVAGRRARDGAGEGGRRQARDPPQRQRRVPLAAHGARRRRSSARRSTARTSRDPRFPSTRT